MRALGNDIAEAREHPTQELGADLAISRSFSGKEPSTLATAWDEFRSTHVDIELYHMALREIVERDPAVFQDQE